MGESPDVDREALARQITHWRRVCDRVWAVLILVILLGCGVGWVVTGQADWLYAGPFYGMVPLIGFIYTHFYMLNPKRDPAATQARLVKLAERQRKNSRLILLFNGWTFIVTSPVMFVIAVGKGAEEYGVWGAIFGALVGGFCLAVGVGALVWSRRYKTPPTQARSSSSEEVLSKDRIYDRSGVR